MSDDTKQPPDDLLREIVQAMKEATHAELQHKFPQATQFIDSLEGKTRKRVIAYRALVELGSAVDSRMPDEQLDRLAMAIFFAICDFDDAILDKVQRLYAIFKAKILLDKAARYNATHPTANPEGKHNVH